MPQFGFSFKQSRSWLACAAIILLCNLYGCALFQPHPPTPPPPPALSVDAAPFVGTPLSGPTTAPAPNLSAADTLRIDIDWTALPQFPAAELLPLDAQSHLTSAPLASGPLLTVGRATRLIRFGDGNFAGAFVAKMRSGAMGQISPVTHQSGLIAPGTTIRFNCALPHDPGKAVRSITLWVSLTHAGAITNPTTTQATQPTTGTMAIGVEGLTAPASPSSPTGQETAFINDLSLLDDGPFAILLPCTIGGTPWKSLAAIVSIHRVADDTNSAAAIASLHDDLSAASARVQAGLSLPATGNLPELQSAISALNRHESLRPPLLFLATNTNADIASDFVLVADDAMLKQLSDDVLAKFPSQQSAIVPADLGWLLDRSALLLMTDQATKNKLPPEMVSVLVLHTGELGRHPDALEEVIKSVNSIADLKLRVIGENFIALEDNSPAARVRAYDWLKSQGKAPADFDPMGTRKSRREAIDKALAANGGAQ